MRLKTNEYQFGYFYGAESEQFSFYRIPKLLIKDPKFKGLSSDAKLLYGLMLERMSLSMKNGWFDDQDRAYIVYTIDMITEDLGVGRDKAIKIMSTLDSKKGIGLIERVRRGQGKPDIIYVKNFVHEISQEEEKVTEIQKSENQTSRDRHISEVGKADFKESEIATSGNRESRLPDVGESDSNYTDKNYTDMSYPDSINLSICAEGKDVPFASAKSKENDGSMGWMGKDNSYQFANLYMKLIRENIDYDSFKQSMKPWEFEMYDELYDLICEVVCVKRDSIRIGGCDYPYELVKSRFLKLDSTHLQYVMETMKKTTTKINNIKAYMLAALFNAPGTINHYYQQEVNHDLYGVG